MVIERSDYRSLRVGEHIPPSAKGVLASLGIADVLASPQHASCPGIRSVWGGDKPVDRDYLLNPYGEGLNVSRPDFDMSLMSTAEQLGAEIMTGARPGDLRRTAGSWRLSVEQAKVPRQIHAKILIDATGRNAAIAKQLGAAPVVYDHLIGIVGRVSGATGGNALVLVEALEQGWWYSAGLSDESIVATFLTDADLIETSNHARARIWREHLAAACMTSRRLAALDRPDQLHVRTARTQRLNKAAGDGWLAVGDAAMSFDPLSSEGISKGLEWGKRAAAVVAALCQGDHSATQAYQTDIDTAFAEYLEIRQRYYASEQRWSEAPFWRRRQGPPTPVCAADARPT